MRINYFSDVHLEFGDQDLPDTDADIVVAAGDIGVFAQGVEWLKAIGKPVIYVAGNHEFYGYEYRQTLSMLREQCAGSPIRFLEKDQFIFQGIRFLGCTLWSDLFVEGLDKAEALGRSLNDFRKISFGDCPFQPEHFAALHLDARVWLEQRLAEPYTGKTVVVTHHAPTEWSWIDSPNVIKKIAYCNDLKPLFHEYEIAAWFHGHVHNLGDYRIADARILSNTRGYLGRKTVAGFDINKVVEI
ncbi:metallophosphoesterase [Methylomonas koyamae]|uniref:Metallophosphoesterase n=1 Tax=Methylomonas koyamae TaxID=702114 RepID=A0A177NDY4_9GAMM|nr:metallophosphoesterase [Methylomonas koyamae]OAI15379.1 metallophosphoesterase [Methylomonas koyamae]